MATNECGKNKKKRKKAKKHQKAGREVRVEGIPGYIGDKPLEDILNYIEDTPKKTCNSSQVSTTVKLKDKKNTQPECQD